MSCFFVLLLVCDICTKQKWFLRKDGQKKSMNVIGRSVYMTDSYNVYHNTFLMIFLYEVVGKIEDVDF